MRCPKCNVESGTRFCGRCGLDLEIYQELSALRDELESLRRQMSGLTLGSSPQWTAPRQEPTQESGVPPETPKPPPLPVGPAGQAGSPKPSAELALGQKWFLGIGVLVLIVGIGFFLKYAFDQEWLGPSVQIATGFFCGVILLFFGGVCHRRELRGLDVGIGAFGLGTLYLSSYAASQVHHLLPAGLALTLILIVTMIGACLSSLWMAQSLAILTFLGAYLAPLLFSSEQFNPWIFLGYLAILALGGQFLAFAKDWKILYLIGAGLTWLALLNWTQIFYRRAWFLETFIFVQVLFAAFSLMPFIRSLLKGEPRWPVGFVLAAVNGLLCCWYSASLLEYQKNPGSLVSLSYAIVCIAIGLLVWLRERLISDWLIAQGLTFLLVFWAQFLSSSWACVFWSGEVIVLYWIAARSEDRLLLFGTAIIGAAVFLQGVWEWADFAFSSRNDVGFTSDFGSRWGSGTAAVASLLLVSWLDRTRRVHRIHPKFNRLFEALGVLRLFLFANVEVLRFGAEFLRAVEVVALSVLWSLFAAALMTLGVWFRRKAYRLAAIVLLLGTVLKVLAYDTAEVSTPYRILSCMVLGAILVVVSFLYYRFSERLTGK